MSKSGSLQHEWQFCCCWKNKDVVHEQQTTGASAAGDHSGVCQWNQRAVQAPPRLLQVWSNIVKSNTQDSHGNGRESRVVLLWLSKNYGKSKCTFSRQPADLAHWRKSCQSGTLKEILLIWCAEGNPADLLCWRKSCWFGALKEILLIRCAEGNPADLVRWRKSCWFGTLKGIL